MVYMSEFVEYDVDDDDHKAACIKEKKDLETPAPLDKFDIHVPLAKQVSPNKSPKNCKHKPSKTATLARPRKIDHRVSVY